MAKKEADLGIHHGVQVSMSIEDDSIASGSGTVPGIVTLRNNNKYPVTELEGQIKSELNIMPSNLSFKKIDSGGNKTVHFLVNVTDATEPGNYKINVDFDFKIDTPPATTSDMTIDVT